VGAAFTNGPFLLCPRCGRQDALRTKCFCGYTSYTARGTMPQERPAVTEPDPSTLACEQATGQPAAHFIGLAIKALISVASLAACVIGLYHFLTSGWSQRRETGIDAVRKDIDQINQVHVSKAERNNRDTISRLEKQTQLLQAAKTDREAEMALNEVERQLLMSVRVQMLLEGMSREQLETMPRARQVPDDLLKSIGDQRAPNAGEVAEAARVVRVELRRVATDHPEVFAAVYKRICEKTLPFGELPMPEVKVVVDRHDRTSSKKAEPRTEGGRPRE
jgi:hypothetical protein